METPLIDDYMHIDNGYKYNTVTTCSCFVLTRLLVAFPFSSFFVVENMQCTEAAHTGVTLYITDIHFPNSRSEF